MKEKSKLDEIIDGNPEIQALLKQAEERMFPQMEQSGIVIAFCKGKFDAKLALEIGAMLLFDKPMILVVSKLRPVPARLLRIADAVVTLDEDWATNPEKTADAVTEAMATVHTRYPTGKRT
jgi:hypothetical protein